MFIFDPAYFIYIMPALILAMWAQAKVSGAFKKYSQVASRRGFTGAQVARRILDNAGVRETSVESTHGELTDHYDPRSRTVRLSRGVYASSSLAALGVAAHEAGHALQHQEGYLWLGLRNTIIPLTQFGSQMAFPLFFIGILAQLEFLMTLGILFFSAAVVFQLVTLPVEYNASARAMRLLEAEGFVDPEEVGPTRAVLSAAALTYLAAALMAVMQLLYLLALRGRRS